MRYVTCNRCNLTCGRAQLKIPVVAHNSCRYDLHHIVASLRKGRHINVLAKNKERFISIRWGRHLTFIDSINFITGSLDQLASTLPSEVLSSYLKLISTNERKQELLKQKASFPYDFLDSPQKLTYTELPDRQCFHNSLTDTALSAEDYKRALTIWKVFECATIQDYMELYVTLDVVLLTAIVEFYRQSTYEHFHLDPMHYVSAPSMCFDAMLRLTGIKLDTLPSIDMYLFFTKAVRGGMTGASVRYAEANNDLCRDFDETSEVSHMIGLDANNLYGHSLCQYLPTSDFQWLTKGEIERLNVETIAHNNDYGYFLEVDLHYPRELHDIHNDFPLAPEKLDVQKENWSIHTQRLAEKYEMKQQSSGTKLMTTLQDKKNYIVRYLNLQLYMRLGLKLVDTSRYSI